MRWMGIGMGSLCHPTGALMALRGLRTTMLAPHSDTAHAASLPCAHGGCCLWVKFGSLVDLLAGAHHECGKGMKNPTSRHSG